MGIPGFACQIFPSLFSFLVRVDFHKQVFLRHIAIAMTKLHSATLHPPKGSFSQHPSFFEGDRTAVRVFRKINGSPQTCLLPFRLSLPLGEPSPLHFLSPAKKKEISLPLDCVCFFLSTTKSLSNKNEVCPFFYCITTREAETRSEAIATKKMRSLVQRVLGFVSPDRSRIDPSTGF